MPMFVALMPIDAGNVRAYNPGDPVHPDNVETNGYVVGEQVAEAGTEQANAALRSLGMLPAADEPDTVPVPADDTDEPAGEYDPAAHTVDAVNAHLDRHPDQTDAVLRAEAAGKGRAGIMHGPHGNPPDVAEA